MMQKRKLFGYAVAAMVVVSVLFAGPALARKTVIKLQMFYSPTLPLLGSSMPHCAELVKEASDGQVQFKLFDPGKLVPPGEVLESVSKGRIDAGYSAAGFWAGKIPASPLFTSVPFGPEAPEYMAWMFEGNGLKLYQEMYDRHGYNVKVIPVGIIAPESSGWFTKEIDTLEDLKGIKMRFFGLGGQVMQKLGVSVTVLPGAEIFPALEKGAIDATEFSMPLLDKNLGFYKIAKYNYFPGWHQQATITELLINKETWNGLDPWQQRLIEICAKATMTWSLATGEALQGPVIKENIEEHGVKVRYWGPEFMDAFKKAWLEVVEEQKEDPFFAKVWKDLEAFRADYDYWQRHGFLPREVGIEEQ